MAYATDVKLFGKWTYEGVAVGDISLDDFIAVKAKDATYLPHTAGRYQVKRFRKALCPIVERLVNVLMRKGRNNGKKMLAVRIVQQAFELIHLSTDENPLQVRTHAVVVVVVAAPAMHDGGAVTHSRAALARRSSCAPS